jgi:hypothetical protein
MEHGLYSEIQSKNLSRNQTSKTSHMDYLPEVARAFMTDGTSSRLGELIGRRGAAMMQWLPDHPPTTGKV